MSTVAGVPSVGTLGDLPAPLPASLPGNYGVAVNQTTGSLYITVRSAVLVAYNPLSDPFTTAMATPGSQQTLTASDGNGIYTWSLSTNNSGGSTTPTGIYTAGPNAGVTDTAMVTDSASASSTISVVVASGASQPVPAMGPFHVFLTGAILVTLGLNRYRLRLAREEE